MVDSQLFDSISYNYTACHSLCCCCKNTKGVLFAYDGPRRHNTSYTMGHGPSGHALHCSTCHLIATNINKNNSTSSFFIIINQQNP